MRERDKPGPWTALGSLDADWAVATDPSRRGGRWREHLDEFYALGERDITECLSRIPEDVGRGRALDYGGGTGRLSFALAKRFDSVTTLDVSVPMQEILARRAVERGISNIVVDQVVKFRPRGDHDLAVSLLTLQHLPNRRAVAEALQLITASIRPGGYLYVEIPVRAINLRSALQIRSRLHRVARRFGVSAEWLIKHNFTGISMLSARPDWVEGVLTRAGCTLQNRYEYQMGSHVEAIYLAQRDARRSAHKLIEG